jgi:hypothetical protein
VRAEAELSQYPLRSDVASVPVRIETNAARRSLRSAPRMAPGSVPKRSGHSPRLARVVVLLCTASSQRGVLFVQRSLPFQGRTLATQPMTRGTPRAPRAVAAERVICHRLMRITRRVASYVAENVSEVARR